MVDLTPWSFLSAVSLSICLMACVTLGDRRDMRAPIIFLIAYYFPYVIAEGPLPNGIVSLVAGHTLLAVGFYLESRRWYGDAVGILWAMASLLGAAAVMGWIPSETGQGIAHNYWHYLACLNHAMNLTVAGAIYARSRHHA